MLHQGSDIVWQNDTKWILHWIQGWWHGYDTHSSVHWSTDPVCPVWCAESSTHGSARRSCAGERDADITARSHRISKRRNFQHGLSTVWRRMEIHSAKLTWIWARLMQWSILWHYRITYLSKREIIGYLDICMMRCASTQGRCWIRVSSGHPIAHELQMLC